ncbi:hypothetical protein FOA52_007006 [Chlamydomonas sp. UWO 241]|nr:hypothetical protein FOA52_007006 [Chlamydomonas sp. UWO 241]
MVVPAAPHSRYALSEPDFEDVEATALRSAATKRAVITSCVVFMEAECRVPPTAYGAPVSMDCPLYRSLKQAPTWDHACTGHMFLIAQRPTQADWQAHLESRHAPLVDALSLLAEQLATRYPASTPSGPPACPFGCATLGTPSSHHGSSPVVALRPCGTESLADRMLKLSAANPHRSPARAPPAATGTPPGARATGTAAEAEGQLASAARTPACAPLVAHLARHHVLEMQFMLAYAHELAAVACTPAPRGSVVTAARSDGDGASGGAGGGGDAAGARAYAHELAAVACTPAPHGLVVTAARSDGDGASGSPPWSVARGDIGGGGGEKHSYAQPSHAGEGAGGGGGGGAAGARARGVGCPFRMLAAAAAAATAKPQPAGGSGGAGRSGSGVSPPSVPAVSQHAATPDRAPAAPAVVAAAAGTHDRDRGTSVGNPPPAVQPGQQPPAPASASAASASGGGASGAAAPAAAASAAAPGGRGWRIGAADGGGNVYHVGAAPPGGHTLAAAAAARSYGLGAKIGARQEGAPDVGAQVFAGLRGLEAAVPTLWRMPLLNARKEPIWRLWPPARSVAVERAGELATMDLWDALASFAEGGGMPRGNVLSIPVAAATRLIAGHGSEGQMARDGIVRGALRDASYLGSTRHVRRLFSDCYGSEETAVAAAAVRVAAAAVDGVSLPVCLAMNLVRFVHDVSGRDRPAGGGVVSASFLNAKPAVGGIGVEPRRGGVLRVLFTVASDAVADTVVRSRRNLRDVDPSAAVFDVLSDREEAQHRALWPAFLAAKAAGKRAQFHRARLVVDGERVPAPAC